MTKKSKFVQAMLGSFWESHGMDANNKLTVINESLAKKTDEIFKKIVLEKSVAKYETYESIGDDLSGLADEISFQELNADPSSMHTDLMPAHDDSQQDDDQTDPMAQMGGMDQMGGAQGGPSLDLPEGVEDFDFNSIFEDDEEEDEEGDDEGDEEEEDLKEFDEHDDFKDLDPDMDPDHGEGEGDDHFSDLDGDEEHDPSMMGGDDVHGDDQMGDDHVDITGGDDFESGDMGDDKEGEFDFDFDLPGEEMPGSEEEGDDIHNFDDEDVSKEDMPMEGKKPKKGGSSKMNIVPKNRKASDAHLR